MRTLRVHDVRASGRRTRADESISRCVEADADADEAKADEEARFLVGPGGLDADADGPDADRPDAGADRPDADADKPDAARPGRFDAEAAVASIVMASTVPWKNGSTKTFCSTTV